MVVKILDPQFLMGEAVSARLMQETSELDDLIEQYGNIKARIPR